MRAGVGTAIQGGSLDEHFIQALQWQAVSTLGELGARAIGQAFREQKLDRFTQLLAHAALGCATGAVAGDCGALGGVMGELAAQTLLDNKTAVQVGEELAEAVQSGELSVAKAEALAWCWQARGVDLSVLAAGLSVALAGGDVDVGAGAAENAVRHNALCFGICVGGGLAVIGALWTAYDVSKTYREEGGEAALRQLARDGLIGAVTLGGGAVAYRVGGTVFKSGPKAWRTVKERGIWKRSVEKKGGNNINAVRSSTKPLTQFSKSTIDDAVSLTMKQKGLHIFANRLHPKPWLNDLVARMGGEKNVINAALQNANGRIVPNASGVFNMPVSVGGVNFTIRGFVNQGKPIINSIFIP